MHRLQALVEILPDGQWNLNEDNQLVDPEGNLVEIDSSDPVQKKLYTQLLLELLNNVRIMLWDLNFERKKVTGLFKELRHTKGRVRESYARGVNDAAAVLSGIEVHTPTARDALVDASESMERLLKNEQQLSKKRHNKKDSLAGL